MGLGARACGLVAAALLFVSIPAVADSPAIEAAAVAFHAGDAASTVALATKALSDVNLLPRDRAQLLVERGLAHEMLGEPDEGLVDFTEAINSHALANVEQARAYYDRGVSLDELNRISEALGDYSAALNLDSRYAAALNNRGNAYRRLGRLAEARADYQASLAAGNPHAEYPEYGLGQIAEAQGQLDVARQRYHAALASDPQFALAAERLVALGDAAGNPAPVVLHPPQVVAAPDELQLKPPRLAALRRPHALRVVSATPSLKPALSEDAAAGEMVQLGAWRRESAAADVWSRAQAMAGDLLANLTPRVFPVDLAGKGRLYRLRTGPMSGGAASRLCGALRAGGLACIVVRN